MAVFCKGAIIVKRHSILAFCLGVMLLIVLLAPATESVAAAGTPQRQQAAVTAEAVPTAGEIAAHEQLAAALQAANEKLYEDVLAANQKLAQEVAAANGIGLEIPQLTLPTSDVNTASAAAADKTGKTAGTTETAKPAAETAKPAEAAKPAVATAKPAEAVKTAEQAKPAESAADAKTTEAAGTAKTAETAITAEPVLAESESIPRGENEQAATELHPYTFAAMTGFSIPWDGKPLTKEKGTTFGPSGKEVYYNLNMANVVQQLQDNGYSGYYWVRDDGAKMYGEYVMCAASYDIHPYGSLIETSLGTAIICDTGGFSQNYPYLLDIATVW